MPDVTPNIAEVAEHAEVGRVATASAAFGDLKDILNSIATNPVLSGPLLANFGSRMYSHIITRLERTVTLTKEQRAEIGKLVDKAYGINLVSTAFGSLMMKVAQTTVEIRKASTEMGKFTTLSNMPGGGNNLFAGMLKFRQMQADMMMKYNREFADQFTMNYQQMHMMMRDMGTGKETDRQRQNLSEALTTYGRFYQTNTGGAFSDIRRKFGPDQISAPMTTAMIATMFKAIETGRYGTGDPGQIFEAMKNTMTNGMANNGISDPNKAFLNTMKVFRAVGSKLDYNESADLGGTAARIIAHPTKEGNELQRIGEHFGVKNAGSLLKEYGAGAVPTILQGIAKGFNPNISDALRKSIADVLGTTEFMFDRLKHIELPIEPIKGLDTDLGNLGETADKAANVGIKALDATLAKSNADARGLTDIVAGWLEQGNVKGGEFLQNSGIPPEVMQLIGISTMFAGSRYVIPKLLKYGKNILSSEAGAGIVEAGGTSNAAATYGFSAYNNTTSGTITGEAINVAENGWLRKDLGMGNIANFGNKGGFAGALKGGAQMYGITSGIMNADQFMHNPSVSGGIDTITSGLMASGYTPAMIAGAAGKIEKFGMGYLPTIYGNHNLKDEEILEDKYNHGGVVDLTGIHKEEMHRIQSGGGLNQEDIHRINTKYLEREKEAREGGATEGKDKNRVLGTIIIEGTDGSRLGTLPVNSESMAQDAVHVQMGKWASSTNEYKGG